MTAWRQVLISKECEKCNVSYETVLKFDSIGNYDDDFYEVAQTIYETDDLSKESRYKAWVDRYCADCYNKWTFDLVMAEYESLVELVKEGTVVVKLNHAILLIEDIRIYCKYYIDDLKKQGFQFAPITGNFEKLTIIFNNQEAYPSNQSWLDFLSEITPRIEKNLKKNNWSNGESYYREDYFVVIDSDCRLFVEDLTGNKKFCLHQIKSWAKLMATNLSYKS